jgi:hypothetical protein
MGVKRKIFELKIDEVSNSGYYVRRNFVTYKCHLVLLRAIKSRRL